MKQIVEDRVRYFLGSPYRGREEVRRTIYELRRFGALVLIGGMLRDVAMFGNAYFNSDLDFVIDPIDLAAFDMHMKVVGARVNRFGGYALPSKKWQIDVWPLQRTWAHTHGHVRVRTVGDLRNTTFFLCDAIIYNLDQKKLYVKKGYFELLERKCLEINLRPNPNPIGNAVRAFRYALIKGFKWGPELSRFIDDVVKDAGWLKLKEYENQSYRTSYLNTLKFVEFYSALGKYLSENEVCYFNPVVFSEKKQLRLPYC